jgi:DNA-binding NarL/FixJ family response regulator
MIRVAVYDDSNARRESLRSFLELTPGYFYCGGFENCSQILQDVEIARPELVLMDIEMPLVNGIEGIRLLKKHRPNIKVVVQTAFDDDDRVFAALQAGAEGYIMKNATVLQLAQSIDEVMNGGASMSPSIALKVMRYFAQQPSAAQIPDFALSPKETQVLRLLARGMSYKMIADELGLSFFTVNNHIKKIYEKLQVHSVGEALALAHKNKLV